jgi:large subunit ribosomal protein L31
MQEGIHPNYQLATVSCACGYSFQTRSTRKEIRVEICSNCHPFFTGKQKLVDAAGRVERFTKRFQKTEGKTVHRKAQVKAAQKASVAKKILTTSARSAKEEAPKKKAEAKPKKSAPKE